MRDDEGETPAMSPEQLAELDAALEEADRGDVISADEMLRQMRELRERLSR